MHSKSSTNQKKNRVHTHEGPVFFFFFNARKKHSLSASTLQLFIKPCFQPLSEAVPCKTGSLPLLLFIYFNGD